MIPLDTISRVEKAMGVSDARTDENHKMVVTFHKDRTEEHMEEVRDFMESKGWELDARVSYRKLRFRSV